MQTQTTPSATKPLDFITVRDTKGRASSLSIYGKQHPEYIGVTGNLEHGALIEPASREDADKLIHWLQNWRMRNA